MGKNSKRYRTRIRGFQERARKVKAEAKEKYQKKLEHLKFKYREDEEEILDNVPEEMKEFMDLSIFDREKYERIQIQSYEITCVGETDLSDEAISVLKMHPKFSVMEDLKEGGLEFEQELAYAKVRIQIQKEIDERL